MDNNLIYVGVDAISIAMMVLLVARFLQLAPRSRISWLVLLIGMGMISYILSSRQDYGILVDEPFRVDFGGWFPLMNLLRNSMAAWFMLICHAIFRDGEKTPTVLFVLIGLHLFLEEPLGWMIGETWGTAFWVTFVHEVIPAGFQLVYMGMSLYWLLSEREADLDQTRRKARVFILCFYIAQGVSSLLLERVAMGYQLIPWDWQYPTHVILVSIGTVFTTITIFLLMSPNTILLFAPARKKIARQEPFDDSEHEVGRIRHALEEERIYQQMGLSVAALAAHLGLPEYRLRSLIHNHMGYRNFNALLHHYRVEEVALALAEPDQRQTPILTLALTAGYQSINPFNRAFRNSKGMTPSEYRRNARKEHIESSKNAPISETDQEL